MEQFTQRDNLVVLFADISGSTALYDKLGNSRAVPLITRTLNQLSQVVRTYRGTLIKTIGDEIMCTFSDVVAAVDAACAMQSVMDSQPPGGDQPIFIRIGLHFGEVIHEANDVYGDTVNIAARVTTKTRAQQIMTTNAVIELLPESYSKKIHSVTRTALHGKKEFYEIFQIFWEQDVEPQTRIGRTAYRKPAEMHHELLLRYRQQVITLDENNKSLVIGSGDNCDLIIQNDQVSSHHANLDFFFGKFLISNHSTNGTFVQFSDKHTIQLLFQQIVLHGSGSISLGRDFNSHPIDVIEYIEQ